MERKESGMGAWPVCASARNDLAENWKCGVNLERAPRLNCVFPPRSFTNHLLFETISGYFGKSQRKIMNTTPNPIRILLAADHPMLLQVLTSLLAKQRNSQYLA